MGNFLSSVVHAAGNVAAPLSEAAGGVLSLGGLANNKAATDFTNIGHAISNPNVVASNTSGFFNPNQGSFTNVQQPQSYYTQGQPQSQQSQGGQQNSGTFTQDPQAAARQQYGDPSQYDSQIQGYQGELGGLDTQQNIRLQNLADQYQQGQNNLNDSNALNQRNYNQGVQQNTQSYTQNRTGIMNTTRSNANALQRLLGMNGAGNSSAALEQAPYAAALQGSVDLSGAQKAYGQNEQSLNTNWQDQTRKFKDAQDSLNAQNYQGQNSVRSGIAQQRATLLNSIADASVNKNLANGLTGQAALAGRNQYMPQIQQLQNQITQYGRSNPTPILATPAINTTPTSLTDYIQGKSAQVTDGTPGGAAIDPTFLSVLNGQKRDKYGNPIAA